MLRTTFKPFARAILATLLLLSWNALAVEFPDKPGSADFFVDDAGMLDDVARQTVNELASALLRDERVPIIVVTISSLATYSASELGIEGYAQALFDEWGIGSPEVNYGILLLVSRGDRQARIEFGRDFAQRYDAEAADIMQSLIVPAFKRGDFGLGITDGVRGLVAVARGLALPKATAPWWVLPLAIASSIGFCLLLYNLFKSGRSGWAWALIAAVGAIIFFAMRVAAASGGSGGGFGGGSSGGGGASGSW